MLFLRQKILGKEFRNAYSFILFLLAALASLFQWVTNAGFQLPNLIYWPVAYFLILWILGFSIPNIFIRTLTLTFNKGLVLLFVSSFLFGITHMLLTDVTVVLLERLLMVPENYILYELPDKWLSQWESAFHGFVWYWIYVAILFIVYFREMYQIELVKNKDLEQNLSNAQVKTLSTELNPHFLFNAMNGIAMQIRKGDSEEAVEGIASLGQMLRAVLNTRNEVLISIREELELIEQYISLEKKRFRDRVSVKIHCKPELDVYKVPKLLLQPIVENAFKHGISSETGSGKIDLKLYDEDNRLVLQVFNSGEGMDWATINGKSIGLPNTVERLRRIYQSDYSFRINQKENGVLVEIAIPKRT
ncbi:MAG: histidine kinase [Bacteroidota bacterium]